LRIKFEVRFTPRFSKNIKSLEKTVQVQVVREIDILRTNPYAGKPLHGEWKGVFSLRIDDYHVLYQVKGSVVLLLTVRHRKHVYK
jgi:addiction module RelE/StbE family toxin